MGLGSDLDVKLKCAHTETNKKLTQKEKREHGGGDSCVTQECLWKLQTA